MLNRLAKSELKATRNMTDSSGLRTAPLEKDRSFRDMMNSSIRNRSADRHHPEDLEDDNLTQLRDRRDHSFAKESHGTNFFSSIRNSSTRATDGLGKAGKGLLSKLGRSGSANEREVPTEENYTCIVINLPLVEQARKTRISKRLEDSKDKTEFWMPALPWRCIE